jgi:hypothetical protein
VKFTYLNNKKMIKLKFEKKKERERSWLRTRCKKWRE